MEVFILRVYHLLVYDTPTWEVRTAGVGSWYISISQKRNTCMTFRELHAYIYLDKADK